MEKKKIFILFLIAAELPAVTSCSCLGGAKLTGAKIDSQLPFTRNPPKFETPEEMIAELVAAIRKENILIGVTPLQTFLRFCHCSGTILYKSTDMLRIEIPVLLAKDWRRGKNIEKTNLYDPPQSLQNQRRLLVTAEFNPQTKILESINISYNEL